jgi:hypothetical protein
VEVLKGKRDKGTFSPGGRFSLGRMTSGSGYCIGIVVESRMGGGTAIRSETRNIGFETSIEDGNGLEDVWIVGEPFFRDVQVAFNASLTLSASTIAKLTGSSVEGEESWYAKSMTTTQNGGELSKIHQIGSDDRIYLPLVHTTLFQCIESSI